MSTMEPFPPWLRDVNRLFGGENGRAAFIPPADVLVSDDGVSVYMDVPGVGRDRLEIDLENEVLTIRGERPYPTDAARPVTQQPHRIEIKEGSDVAEASDSPELATARIEGLKPPPDDRRGLGTAPTPPPPDPGDHVGAC